MLRTLWAMHVDHCAYIATCRKYTKSSKAKVTYQEKKITQTVSSGLERLSWETVAENSLRVTVDLVKRNKGGSCTSAYGR